MGNHEFCTECGASDFHYGRPCDPTKKAVEELRQLEIKDRAARARKLVDETIEKLIKLGYPAKVDRGDYRYDVIISGWDLVDGE